MMRWFVFRALLLALAVMIPGGPSAADAPQARKGDSTPRVNLGHGATMFFPSSLKGQVKRTEAGPCRGWWFVPSAGDSPFVSVANDGREDLVVIRRYKGRDGVVGPSMVSTLAPTAAGAARRLVLFRIDAGEHAGMYIMADEDIEFDPESEW